ncbi:MAG: bifunctional nuclease family protein [Anaerolineales bacterium]|nr:bifunctional nuclease family protein [Anaerolineales bacterium]
MSDMIEVTIDSVRVSLMSPQRVIVLRQLDAERYLPIWVGPYEAESITVALQEIEMIRPLTHDLLKNVFTTFNARIVHVEIISLREDIFFGNIIVEANGETIKIDSRPSDAIAMAVRAHVPILVDPGVMDSAGILPEADIQESMPPADGNNSANEDERLSIFEDFLETLENDKKDDAPPFDKDPDPDDET